MRILLDVTTHGITSFQTSHSTGAIGHIAQAAHPYKIRNESRRTGKGGMKPALAVMPFDEAFYASHSTMQAFKNGFGVRSPAATAAS